MSQGPAWWRCTAFNKITLAIFRALYCLWTVALSNVVKDRGREGQWARGRLETNSGNWCFFLLTSCLLCPCSLSVSYALLAFFEIPQAVALFCISYKVLAVHCPLFSNYSTSIAGLCRYSCEFFYWFVFFRGSNWILQLYTIRCSTNIHVPRHYCETHANCAIIKHLNLNLYEPVTNFLCVFGFQELTGQKAGYLPSQALGLGECTASHPTCQNRRSSRWATPREGAYPVHNY